MRGAGGESRALKVGLGGGMDGAGPRPGCAHAQGASQGSGMRRP